MGTTIEAYLPLYVETHIRPTQKVVNGHSTLRLIERTVLRLYRGRELASITKLDAMRLQAKLKGCGLAPRTINNVLSVFHRMLVHAVDCELLVRVPDFPKRMRVPKRKLKPGQVLTDEQLGRLYAAAEPFWAAMFEFISNVGLRIGEVRALRWKDVDERNCLLHVDYTCSGVSRVIDLPKGERREVPLNATAQRLIKGLNSGSKFVWSRPRVLGAPDTPLSYYACRTALAQAATAARLPKVTPHMLRHGFASRLAARGKSLQEIQALLGHVDITTTQIYAHLLPSQTRAAVESLDALR